MVAQYRKRGLITPVGKAITSAGISNFYHPRQIREVKKVLGITLDDTRGLLNESQFMKASGLSGITKYRKEGLIHPEGRAITHAGLSNFYHRRQIRELKKALGITLDDTRGLLNERQVRKVSGLANLHNYRRKSLIRPVGRAIAGGTLGYFYHPRQIKELKKRLAALKKAKAAARES
jgi:predicted deacetylase